MALVCSGAKKGGGCWKGGSKEKPYSCIYSEDCFKCITEGRVQTTSKTKDEKRKHVIVKVA